MDRLTLTLHGADGRIRSFVSAQDTTLEHDVWMMRYVRACGLHQVTLNDPEAVLERALASGHVMDLLAGSIVESGVPFSEAAIAERVQWLSSITDAASKAQVREALVGLLFSFFLSGTASSTTSPSSSLAPANPPNRDDDAGESAPAPTVPTPQRETASIESHAAATSSESGDRSSASSPAAIPSA
jgi:hypothetical protein